MSVTDTEDLPRAVQWEATGRRLIAAGEIGKGIHALRQSIGCGSRSSAVLNEISNALLSLSRTAEAIRTLELANQLAPDDRYLQSNLLMAMLYSANHTAEEIASVHRKWGARYRHAAVPFASAGEAQRHTPLRLGYVSSNFRHDPEVFFTAPVLEHHDRSRFAVFCYGNVSRPDSMTKYVEGSADQWRNISGLSDAAVASLIRDDGIDILIDCSGHLADSRVRVFAHRPAPVQISFSLYSATSGLDAIDYRISDATLDPPGLTEHLYPEELLRLPSLFLAYQPPPGTPEPDFPGERKIFGCFHRFHKLSDGTVEAWAEILRELPEWRILFHNGYGGHAEIPHDCRSAVCERFANRGIDPERLIFQGALPIRDHFAMYQNVNISLDTFPYNGMTITCESLWMGVPMVTLAGNSQVSRVGAALLNAVGLESWIAATPEEYVRIAVDAARNQGWMPLRRTLRDRMRETVANGAQFVRELENAFEEIVSPGGQVDAAVSKSTGLA